MASRVSAHRRACAFDFVWLASQSPRRRELLGQIGAAHQLLLPEPHEDAEALEQLKLQAARRRLQARQAALGVPAAPVLCADTTVALGRRILGKPADAREAAEMLAALSGRTHRVLTAVAVWTGRRTVQALSVSRVRMAELPRPVIEAYVASGEPFGKAGSYGIQGAIAGWIVRIDGSHSGIMGLPLHETAQLLRQAAVRLAL
jgi:septum formation protein